MKISVLGGGPAGTYFAIALKSLRPELTITVYEARNESVHSYGLGYTLQTLGYDLLARQDADFMNKLFADETPMIIDKALFKTNNAAQVYPFTKGFSVTRARLMRYLLARAKSLGVVFIERKLQAEDVDDICNQSDLVVAADGVNSLLRRKYSKEFGAVSHAAKLNYSWFINESNQRRTEACFYAFEEPEGVITYTSYPLTDYKQVGVVEMPESAAYQGRFKDKTPKEAQFALSEILSSNGDQISLESAGLPWYSFTMNSVSNPTHKNIALVGDSGFAFHYSLGQGVSSAFTMGYLLSKCIDKTNVKIELALSHYASSISMSLQNPTAISLNSIRWLENINSHFSNTPKQDHIDLFRLKYEYKLAKSA